MSQQAHRSVKNSDLKSAKWWKKEIKRKASNPMNFLIWVLIVLFALFIVLAGYIYSYIPQGGKICCFVIQENIARLIVYVLTVTSIIGVSLASIWKLYNPSYRRYLNLALSLINELNISNQKKTRARDIINEELEYCSQPSFTGKECKGMLSDCCNKLANLF